MGGPVIRGADVLLHSAGRRTQSVDQNGFAVNYLYKLGLLAGLTDSQGNVIVCYTYDATSRLVRKNLGNCSQPTTRARSLFS